MDNCIVILNQDLYPIHKYIYKNLEKNIKIYDIHFIEELSLYIQNKIIEEIFFFP